MSNNIKPSEVSGVLLRELQDVNTDVKFEEVGVVLSIGDGVAHIYGLTNVTENELIEFENGVMGVAMNLTSITFNPLEIANNMKKAGGFIPGIRPGKTTSDYLNKILNYIVFIGAVGLAFVAFIPIFFNGVFNADVSFGGTSIIIIVGVIIETLKQIESQMRVRYYKGFLND